MTRVSLLPGSGEVVQRLLLRVDPVDGIAFAQRQNQILPAIKIQSSWTVQWCAFNGCSIGRFFLFAGTAER